VGARPVLGGAPGLRERHLAPGAHAWAWVAPTAGGGGANGYGAGVKIEIWSDIACPWCYIGKVRFENALSRYEHAADVEVVWRAFQLQPDAPRDNAPSTVEHLTEKYGRSREATLEMMQRVTDVAAEEGLSYQLERAVAANTFDAHRLAKLGEAEGAGEAVMVRLMQAYQSEGANVADPETLVRLGREAGLEEAAVRDLLAGDAFAAEVEADFARARSFGVSGVPFFVIDEQHGISGAQPSEFFLAALRQLGPQQPKLAMVGGADDAAACDDDGCALPQG